MEMVKSLQNQRILKYILLVFIGSIILTISAKIKVPFYPVPMTMQTFVVIFIGMACGWKLGLATVSVYLLEGAYGFPVFAGTPIDGWQIAYLFGNHGIEAFGAGNIGINLTIQEGLGLGIPYMLGHTGGYLLGFLVAVFIAGYLDLKTNIVSIFLKLILSVSVIYILGLIWLGTLIGWDKPIFQLGAAPFLLAELFKILILTLLTKKIIIFRKFI